MTAKTGSENVDASGQRDAESLLTGRRRLLRGGLSAAPVILTVASRPVMAAGAAGRCTTASAFASINASRPSTTTVCGGHGPDYWKDPTCYPHWPPSCVPIGQNATTFDSYFGSSGGYPGRTLLQVLAMTGGGKDAVARHCVAALLNASKGLTPANVLSVTTVKSVWHSFVTRGYYEPTAGVRWYANSAAPAGGGGIVEWLASTMPT